MPLREVRFAITTDQKVELVQLVRKLPAMLSGRIPDEHGIAAGFRARLGFALLSLIAPNFDQMGRGEPGADGTRWPPLTKEYLAYGRRFGSGERTTLLNNAGLNARKHNKGPGDTKGLLSADQLKLWRRTYAQCLARFMIREPERQAKAHAAAVAWVVVKKAGAKTKIEVFGNRKVQMLVDICSLRGSLLPGTITERGVEAEYNPPVGKGANEQVFDIDNAFQVVVGTNVDYARYHHNGKGRRARPLWPTYFPQEWWDEIIGTAISGLQRIKELYKNEQGV